MKRAAICLLFFYSIFNLFSACAEERTAKRIMGIGDDCFALGKYVIHPDGNAVFKLVAAGAGTAGLMLIDEDIRGEVKQRSGETLDAMERIFEPAGRWEIQAILGGGALGAGYFTKDKKLIDASLTGFEAYALSGGFVEIIKFIAGRKRPYEEKGSDAFFESGFSFPSGHAARSFAWASVFSEYYPDKKIVPYISYTLATVVSLSRLESDSHWASDVFFGGCLGFAIGKGLSHIHLKSKDDSVTFFPLLSEDIVAISSCIKF